MIEGRIKFLFYIWVSLFSYTYLAASENVEVFQSYFLGDQFERHYSKETGKLVASFYDGEAFENPLTINLFEDPTILDLYLSSHADNYRIFNFNFFNHARFPKITSVKEWVNYRLKYHLEKVKTKYFMGENAGNLSVEAKTEIQRIADSIPNKIVKNIFLHSLLEKVFRLPFQSSNFYEDLAKFLRRIGYEYNPPGFINLGHCQILKKSVAAVNYCYDDDSIVEKYLESNQISTNQAYSHISLLRKKNAKIVDIFRASLRGLGLTMDQVICEDFGNRVYSISQAEVDRPFYFRKIYTKHTYGDYFLVEKHLPRFLMGNTEDFNSFIHNRGGFYSTLQQAEQRMKLEIQGAEAKEAYRNCVEEEVKHYENSFASKN